MHNCRKGLTLLEIISVMAVISILCLLGYSVYLKASKKIRIGLCINNQKQILSSVLIMALDNQKFLNSLIISHNSIPEKQSNSFWVAPVHCYAYDVNVSILGNEEILSCPEAKLEGDKQIAYGLNLLLMGRNYADITDPEKTPFTIDAKNISVGGISDIDFRHNDGVVTGFVDGHVEWVKKISFYDMLQTIGGFGFADTVMDIDIDFNGVSDVSEHSIAFSNSADISGLASQIMNIKKNKK